MAIGPTLQEARLKKQLTPSKVAELTRMKVQIVNDLEKDDFHRLAATIYVKGFIKLFAECVDLDPRPLIADYVLSLESDNQPSLIPAGVDNPSPQPKPEAPKPKKTTPVTSTEAPAPEPKDSGASDLFSYAKTRRVRVVSDSTTHYAAAAKHTISTKASAASSQLAHYWSTLSQACRTHAETIGNRLTEIHWGDAPLKVIGIVIAVLVVLLFVASGISSCIGSQGVNVPISDELHLAIDTPEPYFD